MRVVCACLLLALPIPVIGSEPVPLDAFFRTPVFGDVRISPDGRFLSAITSVREAGGAHNIVVMDIDTREATTITGYRNPRDVTWHQWLSDDWLAFTMARGRDETTRYYRTEGLFLVRPDGGTGMKLWMAGGISSPREIGIGSTTRSVPDYLLVHGYDIGPYADAYRVDLDDRDLDLVFANDGTVTDWFTDHRGRVRAAVADSEYPNRILRYRPASGDAFETVLELGDGFMHGFDADNRHLWITLRKKDRLELFRFDPETGKAGPAVVSDDVYDIGYGSPTVSFGRDGRPLAVEYAADKPRRVVLDDTWRNHYLALDQTLPDTVNRIVDWDDGERRLLVHASSDRNPGEYYLYDLDRQTLTFLLAPRPWLEPERLSAMTPITYQSRDGHTIRGNLTLPPGHTDGPVPLILFVHGGPFGIRDVWGFDPEVQFLASRGYGVLQVDYRGSGGYGAAFERAGHHQWGLAMQDDLSDAVLWAVEQGITRKDTVCIFGASYGGYAAMMGLGTTPDLYRCGIAYVGVYDLEDLYEHDTESHRSPASNDLLRDYWHQAVGDPKKHRERLRETSPVNHVEKIRAPVLVISGRFDGRIPVSQYRKLIRALRRHDKVFEKRQERREGHGINKEKNKIELYQHIEQFLDKYLPVDGPLAAVANDD